jgi:hypothetical protein
MPLAGCLDVRPLLVGAPTVELDQRPIRVERVQILQVLHEIGAAEAESLVPAALNPTIPPVVSFLVYQAADSEFGPFSLAQVRITARAAVRTRAFHLSACCDNEVAAARLERSFGFRIRPGQTRLRPYHDRIDCTVMEGRTVTLQVSLLDPEPVTGHDVQYAPGMHLARVDGAPRLIQVDTEYEFKKADRGRPSLDLFDPVVWGEGRAAPTQPISASFATCDLQIMPVRYVCNPDIPAAEGTTKVGD